MICDLDGVVWLARVPIPGAAEAVTALRAAGSRVLFVTNNSYSTHEDVVAALAAIGITAEGDLLSSADAAAQLVSAGERALVAGGPGIVEALGRRGVEAVSVHDEADGRFDAVLVGFDRAFDFEALRKASGAVRAGARLVGTNDDATYPTPDGPIPGGGSLLAAVATASGATPIVAGKPHEPMAALVRQELGPLADDPGAVVMVGDRPETDGDFAVRLGVQLRPRAHRRDARRRVGGAGAGGRRRRSRRPRGAAARPSGARRRGVDVAHLNRRSPSARRPSAPPPPRRRERRAGVPIAGRRGGGCHDA